MLQELACTHDRVIGTKQTQRSLERGVAQAVYLANDADERIVKNLKAMCEEKDVPVRMVQSMVELGRACGIEVGAAAAAVIKN